jgi:transposase
MARDPEEKEGGSIAARRRLRRRWPRAEKLAIIRECLQPGASLAGVALAHGANANMVRKWVVKYQRGGYGPLAEATPALLPVVVKPRVTRRSTTTADSTPIVEVGPPWSNWRTNALSQPASNMVERRSSPFVGTAKTCSTA